MQASVTDPRNELLCILICSLITNVLQHRTMTFFTSTAGKVTQDHALAKFCTYTFKQACTKPPPPPPGGGYLHQVGEPKPIFSRFFVTVTTLPLLLCAALL